MTIERDKWLYVHTTTPERAREFFGALPDTEVRKVRGAHGMSPGQVCYAVRAPTPEQAAKGPLPPGVYCPVPK